MNVQVQRDEDSQGVSPYQDGQRGRKEVKR